MRLPLFLSRGVLVLAGFVLFLPLVVNYDYYYPYIFLKSILFRVAVQVMFFLYVLLAVTSPAYRPRFHRIAYALFAYFGVMLISSLPGISVNAWCSWWGDFARMGGMFTELHLLAYFFVLAQALRREREWLVLFTTSLFFGVLMGLSGLVQYLGLDFLYRFEVGDRIKGATGNANWYASHMVLNFFIVFWFLSRKDKDAIYAFIAKIWLLLLILVDLFLLVWDAATAGLNTGIVAAGLTLFPIAGFAVLLHATSLFWFLMRGNVRVGVAFLSLLGLYYLYWMYLSQTRFAVIGLGGSLALLSLFYLWAGVGKKMKTTAVGLILAVLLLPGIVLLNRQSSWVQSSLALRRLTSISFRDVAPRLLAWKATAAAILDRPFFGWGPENHKNAFDLYFPPLLYTERESELWFDRAHNFVLDIGASSGLMGLAAYLTFYGLLFAFLLRMWFRSRDVTNSLLIAALLLAYLFQSLFTFDTVNTDGIVYLLLAYIYYLSGREEPCTAETSKHRPAPIQISWKVWLPIAAAAGIWIPTFWQVVKKPYESNLLVNRGIALEKALNPETGIRGYIFREEIVDCFQRAAGLQTTGRHLVREEFANYASELARTSYVPTQERVRAILRAVAFLEESIQQEPLNARHYMYVASLVNRTYDLLQQSDPVLARSLAEKSLVMLERAESLSPTRPQIHLERGQTLAWLDRTEEAIVAMEKSILLSPEVKDLHVDLVTLYISAGRFDDAAREWQRIKTLSLPVTLADQERLIRFYNSKKQYAPIVALFKERLERVPNDSEVLARLAAVYRDMGDMDSARQTALKAASLHPRGAAELNSFLKSLDKPK